MNEKRAVCTLCIGRRAGEFATLTHGPMERYARRVDAEFIVFDEKRVNFTRSTGFNSILFEKYQIARVLEDHDRVLYLDTDILVTPHAPDVFARVDRAKVGGVFEDIGTEKAHRRQLIQEVQDDLGDVGWQEGFMNSGVFVASKEHARAFTLYETYGFHDGEYEQTNTNWYIRKAGFEIQNIDFRFNFMGMMRIIHGPIHREAYFIHYAGKGGLFPWVPKMDQLKNDHAFFYKGEHLPSLEEC